MTSPTFSLIKIGVNGRPLKLGRRQEAGERGFSPRRVSQATGAWLIAQIRRRPGPQPMRFSVPKTPRH